MGFGVLDGIVDGGHIVAVDLLGIQAKGLCLLGNVAVIQNILSGAVQLIAVVVDEVDNVVQLVGIGKVETLPDLALVGLAVADNAVDSVAAAVNLVAQGGAGSRGHALAQRTGGQVHTGGELTVRMAGELCSRLVQRIGLLHGIEALQPKGGIGHRAGVALAEHQPVPVLPTGILGVHLHDLAVEHGHQVRQVH